MENTAVRLQKFIAECGLASRRDAEKLIQEGKVKVNGVVVTQLGTKVERRKDKVEVEGKSIKKAEKKVYIMLNKPKGYVTTTRDQFGRRSVLELVQDVGVRVYPIGRLDMETSGLILLTNDGDFTYKILHPKHQINKKYIAEVTGIPEPEKLSKFRKGLNIEDYVTAPAQIRILSKNKITSILEIIVHEGRNHQVRKMCDEIGHPVENLKRAAIGKLELNDLQEGKWRFLKDNEISFVFK